MGKANHDRDIFMRKAQSLLIMRARLCTRFLSQCPFVTQKIADDPKNPLLSINYPAVQNW